MSKRRVTIPPADKAMITRSEIRGRYGLRRSQLDSLVYPPAPPIPGRQQLSPRNSVWPVAEIDARLASKIGPKWGREALEYAARQYSTTGKTPAASDSRDDAAIQALQYGIGELKAAMVLVCEALSRVLSG